VGIAFLAGRDRSDRSDAQEGGRVEAILVVVGLSVIVGWVLPIRKVTMTLWFGRRPPD